MQYRSRQILSTKFEIINKRKEKINSSHLMTKIQNRVSFGIQIWDFDLFRI
jgi:hypothetical protein